MSSGPARYFGLLLSKERERERESWWTEISVKRETVRTFLFGGRSPETVGHKVLSSQGISRTFRIFWYLASFLALSAAALFEFSQDSAFCVPLHSEIVTKNALRRKGRCIRSRFFLFCWLFFLFLRRRSDQLTFRVLLAL